MDKNEFYKKSEKIINETFVKVKWYAKVAAEKAGEAAHTTNLLLQKLSLEHQLAKRLSQLGSKVYQEAVREGKVISLEDALVKKIVEETKQVDTQLAQVEALLEAERKAKPSKTSVRRKSGKSS
ncbi:MAG: hypothetical protein KTQ49_05895 [Candidatus Omnitrophica bacterium]|nr:hypothetical protein [Candidatus Omnitrophota bacterium]